MPPPCTSCAVRAFVECRYLMESSILIRSFLGLTISPQKQEIEASIRSSPFAREWLRTDCSHWVLSVLRSLPGLCVLQQDLVRAIANRLTLVLLAQYVLFLASLRRPFFCQVETIFGFICSQNNNVFLGISVGYKSHTDELF